MRLEDLEAPRNVRVQGTFEVDFLAALAAAADDLEVACDGLAAVVGQTAGARVADPSVRAAPTRVDPENVLEAEIVTESRVDDLDGHGDEGPAFLANVCLVAAGADVVVVCQVDVEDQFLGDRLEEAGFAEGFAVAWVGAVDGSNFEARGF